MEKKSSFSSLKIWHLNLLSGLVFLIFYNKPFWAEILKIIQPESYKDYWFILSVFVLVLLVINLVLSLIIWQRSYRYVYPLVFMAAASTAYFIAEYNIVFDKEMFRNVMETNASEARDLMNYRFILYFVLLGVVPGILIFKTRIKRISFGKFLYTKLKSVVFSLLLIGLVIYVNFPTYASIARNNRNLSHLILPTNVIFAGISYLKEQFKSAALPYDAIAHDSSRKNDLNGKKQVTILLLGETARADHFGLNQYSRNTTPKLAEREIVNFSNTYSCGTSTATSLPCIFSHLDKENYSHKVAKNTDNILDFLKAANFDVQWRDNNTGCKGICKNVDFVDLTMVEGNPFCNADECYDEILFNNLFSTIKNNPDNQVYVLHQKGSHGPAYFLRYPQQFEKFQPACKTVQLQKCEVQELNNSYDNTIYYTDYIINSAISLLEKLPDDTVTSLIYLSDHGESLGENNLYLHGTPYIFAPDEQIHVPFIIWLSDAFESTTGITSECLSLKKNQRLSHDNFFHTVLGMTGIETKYYDKNLDILDSCRSGKDK